MGQDIADYQILLAYALLIAILMMISKTRVGYVALYYGLVLFSMMLILTNSKFIVETLAPISKG